MSESSQRSKSPRPDAHAGSRSVVLAARIALLLVAAGAAAVALFVVGLQERPTGDAAARYVCPMHPEVVSAVPGVCPICRMELEPMAATGHGSGSGAISSSTYLTYNIPRWRGTGPDAPAPAWVDGAGGVVAILYADEIEGLAPEAHARFYPSARPNEGIEVHVLREPVESWDRSTSRVRLGADPPNSALRPGDVGWVRLATRARDVPLISYHAVLEGAEGPYVLVASADGRTLAKRPVAIGKVYGDMAFVLSGLRPHERVLTRSAFFVDAERRLRREATIEVTP